MIILRCPGCGVPLQVEVVDEGGDKKIQLSKIADAPAPVKSDRDLILEIIEGESPAGGA